MEYTDNLHLKKPEGTDPADITDINDNMDILDDAKIKQTAVSSPDPGSTSVIAFIDTISQNENGVITPTKKYVRIVDTGAAGLCPGLPMSSDSSKKFLNGDGEWALPLKSGYLIKDYTGSASLTGGQAKNLYASDFSASTPTHYTPVAATAFGTGHSDVLVSKINAKATGQSVMMQIHNTSSQSVTLNDLSLSILYFYIGS